MRIAGAPPRLMCLLGGLAGAVASQPALAQSFTVAKLTGSVDVGYNSNPYLLTGPATDAASVDFEVRPSVSRIERLGRLNLEGYYRRTEYLQRYDGTDSYGGTLSGNYRFNDRITFNGSTAYNSAIVDAATFFGFGLRGFPSSGGDTSGIGGTTGTGAPQPGVLLPDPTNGDVGLIGLRQRKSQLSMAVAFGFRPNTQESWTLGGSATRTRYPSPSGIASDFRSYGVNGGYTRNLSATSTIGATASVMFVDYDGTGSSSRIYSPQLTYSVRLPRGWSVEAGAGVSIVQGNTTASAGTSTSLALQLNACRNGGRTKFCLTGSRSAQASGFNGVGPQSSIRLSYSYRIDEKSSLDTDVSYNTASRNGSGTFDKGPRFILASAGYRRDLNRRVQLVASVNYQDRSGSDGVRQSDIGGRLGIAFTLGSRR